MREFNIYKKRDGQGFEKVSYIYAESFNEACKEFALNMTKDNWEKSNNIVWITQEEGVKETGWYDLNASIIVENNNMEIDFNSSLMELFCSEKSILEGFSSWSEDVYTWEIRDFLDYTEIWDVQEFNDGRESYSYFMAVDGERFFLYNGDFSQISDIENLGHYSDKNDRFMGSGLDDIQFIESILNQ